MRRIDRIFLKLVVISTLAWNWGAGAICQPEIEVTLEKSTFFESRTGLGNLRPQWLGKPGKKWMIQNRKPGVSYFFNDQKNQWCANKYGGDPTDIVCPAPPGKLYDIDRNLDGYVDVSGADLLIQSVAPDKSKDVLGSKVIFSVPGKGKDLNVVGRDGAQTVGEYVFHPPSSPEMNEGFGDDEDGCKDHMISPGSLRGVSGEIDGCLVTKCEKYSSITGTENPPAGAGAALPESLPPNPH